MEGRERSPVAIGDDNTLALADGSDQFGNLLRDDLSGIFGEIGRTDQDGRLICRFRTDFFDLITKSAPTRALIADGDQPLPVRLPC